MSPAQGSPTTVLAREHVIFSADLLTPDGFASADCSFDAVASTRDFPATKPGNSERIVLGEFDEQGGHGEEFEDFNLTNLEDDGLVVADLRGTDSNARTSHLTCALEQLLCDMTLCGAADTVCDDSPMATTEMQEPVVSSAPTPLPLAVVG